MSAMDVDKSLDEMIATNKTARRSAKSNPARRNRPNPITQQTPAHTSAARARFQGAVPAQNRAGVVNGVPAVAGVSGLKAATADSYKVIVSNLPMDVEEAAVRELFVTTVGKVRSVELAYDARGKSKGVATVIFMVKGDAQKAYDSYNNRMIDQKRPLKVEVVVDPSKVPLAARVAPIAPAMVPAAVAVVRTAGPMRNTGRGGARGGRGGRVGRVQKTAADLDQEMLDYAKGNGTTTA